jgi:general nucleoside transport system permease protein
MIRRPLIERRMIPSRSPLARLTAVALSVALGLLVGAVLFIPFGTNPIAAYSSMFKASFGSTNGLTFTLVRATPLILVSLGCIVAWKSGFIFAGFPASLYIGAVVAGVVPLITGPLTPVIFFPIVFLASFLAAGSLGAVTAYTVARLGGNDILLSLMTNYVVVFLVNYLANGPMQSPHESLPQSARIPAGTELPSILPGGGHMGIIIALVAMFSVWVFFRHTVVGYELTVMGLLPRAAAYGGVNTRRRLVLAGMMGAGLAGVAGAIEVLGVYHRFIDGLESGIGFLGIIAALLGGLHPFGVAIASILYSGMTEGSLALQRTAKVPTSTVLMIQSLIVLIILASVVFREYRINLPWLRRSEELLPGGQSSDSSAGDAIEEVSPLSGRTGLP